MDCVARAAQTAPHAVETSFPRTAARKTIANVSSANAATRQQVSAKVANGLYRAAL
jgi:hypothetical protein